MKNLLIAFLILFLGCSKKETENINVYQITLSYIGPRDALVPILILKNTKPDKNIIPIVNYQVDKEDLRTIEEISQSIERVKKGVHPLVLVEINKDNKITKYLFNKNNGVEIFNKIDKITSHYNNKDLHDDLLYLQELTKKDWYNDGKILGI